MPAQERNRVIAIRKPSPDVTRNAHGQVDHSAKPAFVEVAKRAAKPVDHGAREYFRAQQQRADMTHLFEFVWDSVTREIKPTYQLGYGGRDLEVLWARDVNEGHRAVHVACKEAV